MKKRLIWWILIIAWCTMIFYESSNNGNDSGKQSLWVLKVLSEIFNGKMSLSEYFIRKCAHFSEYFILGCLLFKGFCRDKLWKAMAYSSVLGIVYAASDEIHQYFIPGRAPRVFDVFIDSMGLLTGIALLVLFTRLHGRRKLGTRDNSAIM